MEDDFLLTFHRAITHGKVEVWVSVRDVEEKYPTSYYIRSCDDIFDVVLEHLEKYIHYKRFERRLVLEKIVIDDEEILSMTDRLAPLPEDLEEWKTIAARLYVSPEEALEAREKIATALEESAEARKKIVLREEKKIWEKIKNRKKKVELVFGWEYA